MGQEDSADLVTVLGNLVDNAVDACPSGGTVEVSLRPDEEGTVITVRDDGPGIPEADRDRIFESGWSTKGAAGTRGIGLALVRRIARRRGGDVAVSTSAAQGARFDVRLPPPADRPAVPQAGSAPGVPHAPPRQPTPAGGGE